jgi:hypothetical protein
MGSDGLKYFNYDNRWQPAAGKAHAALGPRQRASPLDSRFRVRWPDPYGRFPGAKKLEAQQNF